MGAPWTRSRPEYPPDPRFGWPEPDGVAGLARSATSLRITGELLTPAAVSSLHGCEPTKGWAKGDSIGPDSGSRTTTFGMWLRTATETEPADMDCQVCAILNPLSSDPAVWATLTDHYDVNLLCGWFMEHENEGVSVAPETMAALGRRRIRLDIDLYADDTDSVPADRVSRGRERRH